MGAYGCHPYGLRVRDCGFVDACHFSSSSVISTDNRLILKSSQLPCWKRILMYTRSKQQVAEDLSLAPCRDG